MKAVRPKSHWGQNFLRDEKVAHQIVEHMGISPTDHVLEIGPGTGALTEGLLRTGAHVDCVEIDPELCSVLHDKFMRGHSAMRIFNRDILQCELVELAPREVRIATNAPYNISSKLLNYFCSQAPMIRDVHVMLQKEVGDMLLASTGTKGYKLMSVLMNLAFEIESVMGVSKRLFCPEPKVDSVVLRLVPKQPLAPDISASLNRLLGAAFGERRKKLRNALSGILGDQSACAGFNFERRAEEVAPEEYLALTGHLVKKNGAAKPANAR